LNNTATMTAYKNSDGQTPPTLSNPYADSDIVKWTKTLNGVTTTFASAPTTATITVPATLAENGAVYTAFIQTADGCTGNGSGKLTVNSISCTAKATPATICSPNNSDANSPDHSSTLHVDVSDGTLKTVHWSFDAANTMPAGDGNDLKVTPL